MHHLRENAIKAKLLLPFSLMLMICLLIFIFGFSNEEKSHIAEDFSRNVKATQLSYLSALDAETKTLSSALEFLQNDAVLKQKLISQDREGALNYVTPLFDRLTSRFLITHFYLLNTERQVILRAHEPERYGDTINRLTALEAERTGQPASGIELGVLGTFTLRVVYPIYEANKLTGYIELGEEIEHVIDNVIRSIDIDLSITIDKRFLSQKDWKQGMQMLGHQADWNLLPAFVETYSSIKTPIDFIKKILVDTSTRHDTNSYTIDNKQFYASTLPLIDAGDQEVGKLIIMRDMSERLNTNQQMIIKISALAFLTGILMLIFFYFLADRIEHKLEAARARTIDEAKQRESMHQKYIDELEKKQTELLNAQDEIIRAKNHAEKANNAKSEFLSCMSHELRTPLNIILGYAQILEHMTDTSSDTYNQSVNHILTSGHQMLSLVNDLLDLSTTDLHKLELNINPLNIADITTCCANQITEAMAVHRNIKITNEIINTKAMVFGDDLRVRQILINLLSNAVKYNKDHGRVTISSAVEETGKLKIKIQDTGTGIPDDKQSLLFTPFERINQKHGAISGVGIGLYITKQLVEAMHGTVGVESSQNEGSIFWFQLPLAEESA